MADQWYYTENRQRRGPVSPEQLRGLAGTGQLKPTDKVWKKGMANWEPASSLDWLFPSSAADMAVPPTLPQDLTVSVSESLPTTTEKLDPVARIRGFVTDAVKCSPLKAVGVALFISASLPFLVCLFGLIRVLANDASVGTAFLIGIGFLHNGCILLAGALSPRRKDYWISVVGCVLTWFGWLWLSTPTLSMVGAIIAVPSGLWAFRLLRRPEIRAQFENQFDPVEALMRGSKAAAQLVAKQAERTKLVNVTLPNAYQALGKHVYAEGSFRKDHGDYYQSIESIRKDIEAHSKPATTAIGVAEKAKATVRAAQDLAQVQALKLRLTRAYTELGRAAFGRHGEASGPAGYVQPLVAALARLEKLDAEIAELSQPKAGQVITVQHIATGGMCIAALAVLFLLRGFFWGTGGQEQVTPTTVGSKEVGSDSTVRQAVVDAEKRISRIGDTTTSRLRESVATLSESIGSREREPLREGSSATRPPQRSEPAGRSHAGGSGDAVPVDKQATQAAVVPSPPQQTTMEVVNTPIKTISDYGDLPVEAGCFSPKGDLYLNRTGKRIRLWRTDTWEEMDAGDLAAVKVRTTGGGGSGYESVTGGIAKCPFSPDSSQFLLAAESEMHYLAAANPAQTVSELGKGQDVEWVSNGRYFFSKDLYGGELRDQHNRIAQINAKTIGLHSLRYVITGRATDHFAVIGEKNDRQCLRFCTFPSCRPYPFFVSLSQNYSFEAKDIRTNYCLSSDGALIAATIRCPDESRVVKVWDMVTGRETATLLGEYSRSQIADGEMGLRCLSPDGSRLVTGELWHRQFAFQILTVWELRSSKPLFQIGIRDCGTIAFTEDGNYLITGTHQDSQSKASYVNLWNAKDGTLSKRLVGSRLRSVAATTDARFVATGSDNGILTIWDTRRSETVPYDPLDRVPLGDVSKREVHRDHERTIARFHGDFASTLWPTDKDEPPQTFEKCPATEERAAARCVGMSGDGQFLAYSNDEDIVVWSVKDRQVVATVTDTVADSLAISSDGRRLIARTQSGSVKMWSLPDGAFVKTLAWQTSPIFNCIAIDANIALHNAAEGFRFLSLTDGEQLKTLKFSTRQPWALSADASLLVALSPIDDHVLGLYSTVDARQVAIYRSQSQFGSLMISRDATAFIVGSEKWGESLLVSLPKANLVKRLKWKGSVFAFHLGADTLAAAHGRGVALWSLSDGKFRGLCGAESKSRRAR